MAHLVASSDEQIKKRIRAGPLDDRQHQWPLLPLILSGKNEVDLCNLLIQRYTSIHVSQSETSAGDGGNDEADLDLLIKHFELESIVDKNIFFPLKELITPIVCSQQALFGGIVFSFFERKDHFCLLWDSFDTFDKVLLETFRDNLRLCMPETAMILHDLGILEGSSLCKIFVNFFDGIFHPAAVNRVIEIFLFDGIKSMFRISNALFAFYKRKIKSFDFMNAKQFWLYVSKNNPPIDQLLALAFATKGGIGGGVSCVGLGLARRKKISSAIANKLKIVQNEKKKKKTLPVVPVLEDSKLRVAENLNNVSELLTLNDAEKIAEILPSKDLFSFRQWVCGYKSDLDGSSFLSFYRKCEKKGPCIILIQPLDTPSKENTCVIGIYSSSGVQSPSSNPIHDKHICLFRITSNEVNF